MSKFTDEAAVQISALLNLVDTISEALSSAQDQTGLYDFKQSARSLAQLLRTAETNVERLKSYPTELLALSYLTDKLLEFIDDQIAELTVTLSDRGFVLS